MLGRKGIVGAGLMMMASSTLGAQGTGLTTLAQLRDRARPLLIFAPGPEDPQLVAQLHLLRDHPAAVQDRDLVPVALPYRGAQASAARLSPEEAEEVRRRFHVKPGEFAVVLIGKDGGAKLRSGKPVSIEALNGKIDAMPMRKDEMRSKGSR